MGNKAVKPTPQVKADVADQEIKATDSHHAHNLFDYAVTSIEVVDTEDVEDTETYGEGAKIVKFDGKIKAEKEDTDVAYLMNVRTAEDSTDDNVKFTAISVTQETFLKKLKEQNKKILACVHGFTVEPESWLEDCAKIQENEAFEHLVVPVMWPSIGDRLLPILFYDTEQKAALQVGKALQQISDLGEHIPLSIMCHSMGNRVLMSYCKHGNVASRFENVFMVAADVWEECFNERVNTNTWFQPPWNYWNLWEDAGLKLSKMLKDGGKIHIISYSGDRALMSSQYAENWRTRLGRYGKAGQAGRIHPEIEDKLIGYSLDDSTELIDEVDSLIKHSYHMMPKLCEYYSNIMKGE